MSAGDYTDDQLVNAVRLAGGWAPLSAVRAQLEAVDGLDAGWGPRAKAATRRRLNAAVEAGRLAAEDRPCNGRVQRCWTTAERFAEIERERNLTDAERAARALALVTAEYQRKRAATPEDEYATLWSVTPSRTWARDLQCAVAAGTVVAAGRGRDRGYLPADQLAEYEAARARARAARQAISDRQRAARDRLKQLAAVPPLPARTERGTSVLVHCVELTLDEAEALVRLLDGAQ